jgi:hypothetical protein
MKVSPSKRLVAKPAKANRVSAFQCWKRYLPARSGADKLMALKVCKRKVGRVKGLLINLPKQIGFPFFNTGRENLPVNSGADKLMALKVRKS